MLYFYFFFFLMIRRPPRSTPLSLHDALPISKDARLEFSPSFSPDGAWLVYATWTDVPDAACIRRDRKSTRLNSSHANISYAVFCLKKKKSRQTASSTVCITLTKIGATPTPAS